MAIGRSRFDGGPIHDNNLSARVQNLMDEVYGEPDFGSAIRPKRTANLSEFPVEARPMIEKIARGRVEVDQFEVHRELYDAIGAAMREDKGFLGILPGNGEISPREEARAARRDELVKPLMDWIRQTW